MNDQPDNRIYSDFLGFRAPADLVVRLDRFSQKMGRRNSDVMRFLITRCLNSYEGDEQSIAKIKTEFY